MVKTHFQKSPRALAGYLLFAGIVLLTQPVTAQPRRVGNYSSGLFVVEESEKVGVQQLFGTSETHPGPIETCPLCREIKALQKIGAMDDYGRVDLGKLSSVQLRALEEAIREAIRLEENRPSAVDRRAVLNYVIALRQGKERREQAEADRLRENWRRKQWEEEQKRLR
ncbi:MAG: hypothetical protein JO112_10325, partial [Planctomycetes bacterium]|nr:hypothetical protein [Planctomycetota bacterium]